MAYCGWSTYCNKFILDASSVSVGEGAVVQDSIENGGLKKSRLTCSNPPDKYSIVMYFNCVDKKDNGYTELENFYKWYKFVHKFGTVPFQFPAILLNSNRTEGLSQEEIRYKQARDRNFVPDTEYYCITSAVEGSKSGLGQEIKMTWETYAINTIQVETEEVVIDHIHAENGYVDVILTDTPETEPDSSTWNVFIKSSLSDEWVPLTITNCFFDGDTTATLYFTPVTEPGEYMVKIGNVQPSIFVVSSESSESDEENNEVQP